LEINRQKVMEKIGDHEVVLEEHLYYGEKRPADRWNIGRAINALIKEGVLVRMPTRGNLYLRVCRKRSSEEIERVAEIVRQRAEQAAEPPAPLGDWRSRPGQPLRVIPDQKPVRA
jgi:hypothetical protein